MQNMNNENDEERSLNQFELKNYCFKNALS